MKKISDIKVERLKKTAEKGIEISREGLNVVVQFMQLVWNRGKEAAQKYPRIALTIAVVLVMLILTGGKNTASIGVVDILKVREQASLYQNILAEQEKQETEWRIRFGAEKDILAQEDKALAEKRSKTNKATFKKEVDAFQQKVIAFQQKYQTEYAQIMMASQMAMQQADQKVLEVMKKVGEREDMTTILPKAAVFYAADTADLTETFIRQLNRENFAVSYPDPKTMTLPTQQ